MFYKLSSWYAMHFVAMLKNFTLPTFVLMMMFVTGNTVSLHVSRSLFWRYFLILGIYSWGALALPSLKILEIGCDWMWDWGQDDELEMFSCCDPDLDSLILVDFCFRSARICAPKLTNFELCASPCYDLVSLRILNYLHQVRKLSSLATFYQLSRLH